MNVLFTAMVHFPLSPAEFAALKAIQDILCLTQKSAEDKCTEARQVSSEKNETPKRIGRAPSPDSVASLTKLFLQNHGGKASIIDVIRFLEEKKSDMDPLRIRIGLERAIKRPPQHFPLRREGEYLILK